MTRYFVAKIWLFDEEDFNTPQKMRQKIEVGLDEICKRCEGLIWESVEAKEVELEEYEKED